MRRTASTLALLFAAAALLTTASCASGSKSTRTDQGAGDEASSKQQREPEAPTPEELAESPCGNPNWAQLPDQHEVDGDPERPEDADDDEESSPPAEEENRSSGGEARDAPDETP